MEIRALGLSAKAYRKLELYGVHTFEELVERIRNREVSDWDEFSKELSARDLGKIYKEFYSPEWYGPYRESLDAPQSRYHDSIVFFKHLTKATGIWTNVAPLTPAIEDIEIDRIKGTFVLNCFDENLEALFTVKILPDRQWLERFFSLAEAVDWYQDYTRHLIDPSYTWRAEVTFAGNRRKVSTQGETHTLLWAEPVAHEMSVLVEELLESKRFQYDVRMF